MRVIAWVAQGVAGFGLDLDLQAGFDDVERVDEGVCYDGAGGAGDCETPGWDFCFGEGGHFVVVGFFLSFYRVDSGGRMLLLKGGIAIKVFRLLTLRYRYGAANVEICQRDIFAKGLLNGCDMGDMCVRYAKDPTY